MNTLSDTVLHRVKRRVSHLRERHILPHPTNGPIVTFGFDDCPLSAIETALPILEAEGWRGTVYVCVGLCDTINHLGLHMSESDIVKVHARGHEIADHTFAHINAKVPSPDVYLEDIARNQAALAQLGIPSSEHFAYPFGDVTTPIKRKLRHQFSTLRGVIPPTSPNLDANYLPAMPLYSGPEIGAIMDKIATLATEPRWLNLFTHDVRSAPSGFGCSPEDFVTVVQAVKDSGARVMTAASAYRTLQREAAR